MPWIDAYSIFAVYSAGKLVSDTIAYERTVFGTLVALTSQKLNILNLFNAVIVVCMQFSNLLVWVFFGEIRMIESRYVMDKAQKKIF